MEQLRLRNAICIAVCLVGFFSFDALPRANAQRAEKPELVIQDGHLANVEDVVFSPNGQLLASAVGAGDGAIKLWEVSSGRLIRNVSGARFGVRRLAFSPDGRFIAASSHGSVVCQIWDINSGKLVHSLDPGKGSQVEAIAFNPSDATFAFASGSLYVWDLSKQTRLHALGRDVSAIAYSPNGKTIVGVDREGGSTGGRQVRLWQAETGQLLHSLPANAEFGPKVLSFSPDGRTIAVLTDAGTIDLWDAINGKSIRSLASPDYNSRGRGLRALRFSSDGKKLFVLFNPNTGNVFEHLDVWDLATGKLNRQIPSEKGMEINGDVFAFGPGDAMFATGFFDAIRLSDTNSGRTIRVIDGHEKSIASLIVNPLQKTVVLGSSEEAASMWDAGQSLICKLADPTSYFRSIKFSPDGRMVLLRHVSGTGSLWKQGDCNEILKGSGISPENSVFTPDGKHIAVTEDKSIKILSTEKNELVRVLQGHTDRIVSVVFSPNGKYCASTSKDKTVKVWNWEQGEILHSLEDPQYEGGVVAFSPDGKILASGDGDVPFYVRSGGRKIKLWEVSSGKLLRSFGTHEQAIKAITFSSDGKLIASSSRDTTVKVWDVSRGELIQQLQGHPKSDGSNNLGIWFLAFSQDAKTLVTRDDTPSYDSTINFWDVSSGKLLSEVSGDPDIRSIQFTADGKSILIATRSRYKDTMTNLYSTSGELLVSVVGFPNGSWIVTTNDGLFDGSPDILNRINWRFAGNEVSPVEAFFNEFYYPGLLLDVLDGKRPRAAADITRKDRRQPAIAFVDQKPDSDDNPAVVSQREFKVRLEVVEASPDAEHSQGSGVKDVRLFRNGSLVKLWRGNVAQKGGRAILETTVAITAGENRFTAYAFNRDNVKSLDAQMLVRGNESLARKGTAYVLTVGINRYSNAQFNLKHAVADAEDFGVEVRKQLTRLGRFDLIHMIPLVDQQATKTNILAALRRLSGAAGNASAESSVPGLSEIKAAQPEDAVILFFASHGMAWENQFYLIPHDVGDRGGRTALSEPDLRRLIDHSLSDRELDQVMEGINAGQLLLVVDACNSGQALEAEERRRGPMNSKGLAQLAYEKGMYILTAAQSYQAALEATQLGHGLLTYALIEEGVKKANADREPQDGQLTVSELLKFASERVPQIQTEKLESARGLRVKLSFVENVNQKAPVAEGELQRPRAFYRSELTRSPFVLAVFGGPR